MYKMASQPKMAKNRKGRSIDVNRPMDCSLQMWWPYLPVTFKKNLETELKK